MDSDLYLTLTHYGWALPHPKSGWHTIKCGAHGDSRPSCRINYDIGQVKCMTCDYAGDAIEVIRIEEGCDYRAAFQRLEEITGRTNQPLRATGTTGRGIPTSTRGNTRSRSNATTGVRRNTFGRG